MFLLLVIVVTLHQIYATLMKQVDKWPLRLIYLRIIETIGRCAVPPIIIGYFFQNIDIAQVPREDACLAAVIVICVGVFFQECYAIRQTYREAVHKLVIKMNNPETTVRETSRLERLLINYLVFNRISTESMYISEMLATKGAIRYDVKVDMLMKNEFSLANLTGKKTKKLKTKSQRMKAVFGNTDSGGANRTSADGDVSFQFSENEENKNRTMSRDKPNNSSGALEMNTFRNVLSADIITEKAKAQATTTRESYTVENPMVFQERRSASTSDINVDSDDENEEV